MCEIAYTSAITAISTAITIGIAAAANTLIATAYKGSVEGMSELGKRMVAYATEKSIALNKFVFVESLIKGVQSEIMQELFLDPWIESIAIGLTKSWAPEWLQLLFSSLAEGLRETLTGPIAQLLSGQTSSMFDTQQFKQMTTLEQIQFMQEHRTQIQQEATQSWLGVLGSSVFSELGFFFTAWLGATNMFLSPVFSASIATISIYCRTEDISLKGIFANLFGKIQQIGQIFQFPSLKLEDLGALSGRSEIGNKESHDWSKILSYIGIGIGIGIAAGLPISVKFGVLAGFTTFIGVSLAGYAGMVNSESDLLGNLVKKDGKEITIENLIFEMIQVLPETKLLGYELKNLEEEIRPDVTIEQFRLTEQALELYIKGPKYYYGIIYKITEKSTNKVRIGQARGSFQARWNKYKNAAKMDISKISGDVRSFEKLLKDYIDFGLDIDNVGPGINNEYFEVEILALVPHHEDSQISQAILNDLEEHYVRRFRANNRFFGYNILPGGDPSRFLAQETIKKQEPSSIELESAIDDSIFNSLTKSEVAESFGVSESTLERWIQNAFKKRENGVLVAMTYSEKRFERITEILKPYLEQGYSPSQLANIFGVSPSTITNWIKRMYEGKNWQQTMMDIMPRLIKEKIIEGHINYDELAKDFPGIPKRHEKIENFINKYIDDLTKSQLKYYQKQAGIDLIKENKNAKEILLKLGYSPDSLRSNYQVEKKFSELFDGMTYEEARYFYITKNLRRSLNQNI